MTLESVAAEAVAEADRAAALWPPFNSGLEGYAILLEEVEELKFHVFTNQKRRDLDGMRQEAVHTAAMALRFLYDTCGAVSHRRAADLAVADADGRKVFDSAHEGFGFILRSLRHLEFDVLGASNPAHSPNPYTRAVAVARDAVKFIHEICDGGKGRK